MAAQANANASSATVLGMGNPLLDISVDCGQELLEKYGLSMNNAIMAEEKHMPLYKEILGMKPIQVAGGATQNSIRTLQWMSEEEVGCCCCCCVDRRVPRGVSVVCVVLGWRQRTGVTEEVVVVVCKPR